MFLVYNIYIYILIIFLPIVFINHCIEYGIVWELENLYLLFREMEIEYMMKKMRVAYVVLGFCFVFFFNAKKKMQIIMD